MTYNEQIKEFGEKLSLLLSVMINKKTELKFSGRNGNSIEYYIYVEGDKRESHYDCNKFSDDQAYPEWEHKTETHTPNRLFNFKGMVGNNDAYAAMFNITEETLNLYKFDENIISSMKSINKYNL